MDLAGILVIDKPKGITSHDVVYKVKKIIGAIKVGHTGTLDPMATGVLTLCINKATKAARLLDGGVKEYIATIRLGIETDTYDADGKVVAESDCSSIVEGDITEVVSNFIGRIGQVPPMFSAIKRNGVPLYKLARKGITVKREPREVDVHSIDIENLELPFITLRIACSKGTYIRSLCHDIGEKLGCGAHLTALRRVRNGQFTIDDAVGLNLESASLIDRIKSLDEVFSGSPEGDSWC